MLLEKSKENFRTQEEVEEMMYSLWDDYFSDVPRKNLVLINFGRRSMRRLGSIKWAGKHTRIKSLLKRKLEEYNIQDDKRISVITLTRYYMDRAVPDIVVKMTIAHEMVHYAHGFHSPLPKLFSHPHRGNIVNKELIKRGLGNELNEAEKWLNENWVKYLKKVKNS